MDKEKIVERVRKLLELSKSDNVNEAGNAAAAAQQLMSAHAISEAMLVEVDAAAEAEAIEEDVLDAGNNARKAATWKGMLSNVVCAVNSCASYWRGAVLYVVGKPGDAAQARYLFAYIVREVDRLTEAASEERGRPGKTWCNNFRIGAVMTIARRLREADAAARAAARREADASDTLGNGVALVRVNTALARIDSTRAEVDTRMRKMFPRSRGGRKAYMRLDSSARVAGMRAGASVSLNPARGGALSAGRRPSLRG